MPRSDSRLQLTGTYSASTGLTAWTLPFTDNTIDCVVLSDSYGSAKGLVVPVHHTFNNLVYAAGNYSAYPVIVGRNYDFYVELTRPFRRDQDGKAIASDRVQVELVLAEHRNSGEYVIRQEQDNRADRERTRDYPAGTLTESEGEVRAFLNGDAKTSSWFIENDTPLPTTITAVEFVAEVSGKTRR